MTNPQRIDFHQRDVPRPIELKGNHSPCRMIASRAAALIQSSVSFTIAEPVVRIGAKYKIVCRISNIAKSDRNRPIQVAREIFAGGVGLSNMSSVTEMPHIGSLDSRIFSSRLSCGGQRKTTKRSHSEATIVAKAAACGRFLRAAQFESAGSRRADCIAVATDDRFFRASAESRARL
jgi:hypothetical protein